MTIRLYHLQAFCRHGFALDLLDHFISGVNLQTPIKHFEQYLALNKAIFECGVFFVPFRAVKELAPSVCVVFDVSAIAYQCVFVCKSDIIFGKSTADCLACIAPYIEHLYIIEGITSFVPVGIKVEHTAVEVGIVGVCAFNFVLLDVLNHRADCRTPICKSCFATTQFAYIERFFVRIVGGFK